MWTCPVSLPLTIIYNRSVKDGVFPSEWKRSRVVPVYKKGDITVLFVFYLVFSKLFESVLYPIISKSVDGCIIDEQHGFRRGRSIQTNLISFVTETMRTELRELTKICEAKLVVYADAQLHELS
ncbi:unnamed protein product [Pieris brassicae]|uniref:Reverse transcriptase domain-containing protein n=1 Tax=Pieris brassicae TaxID=7116 RepID=A0A9P0TNJ7_PIEBR|nr:unnamed protein product [Pieris brassicae]